MKYIFIINGREDKKFILPQVQSQLESLSSPPEYDIYVTRGRGDATRHVRLYNDFHPGEIVCFVACGGTGTVNEVASGIVGFEGKSLAVLAYGESNDFIKNFPGRDFKSISAILGGEDKDIDIIKCNDDYAINTAHFGFDAFTAFEADGYISDRKSKPYIRGLIKSVLFHRFNRFKVLADGKKISGHLILLCLAGNGRYCGNMFCAAPKAELDDSLMDICLIKGISLLRFALMLPSYIKGTHIESFISRGAVKYVQCRKMEVFSKDLLLTCLDGEVSGSRHFSLKILGKAIRLRLPSTNNNI